MAAEDVAVRDAAARVGGAETSSAWTRARAISIHYLQANSKAIDLVAWANDDDVERQGARSIRSTQVEARRGHRLCNTATIVWGEGA